ncbi:hypothetical protein CONPUDRAFT_50370 [Coniophora puteana RWD-64-598 SS2]|uniref:Cytochrome P450 n=1 Tax=Coniophora puteana (strain RWD-64-598) TaxID=741705 RepID=A0A5M3MZ66_CONPW|nr:uncharacterized protein CONPUDRAFT_50370 [Coniophora puteana RWD-64-598 SS2]EIW84419.1 hypothetical protein CONPUDRAFT_50370 [Coniophora puteana RWD-64-598 SS2]
MLVAALCARRRLRDKGLPPGPDPLPLVGNVLQVNPAYPWLTFAEWKLVYGNMVYCRILGRDTVVINSEKVAQDLLDKQSRNYSDRMSMSNLPTM